MFSKKKWSPWWSLMTFWIVMLWYVASKAQETGDFGEKFAALFPLSMLGTAVLAIVAYLRSKRQAQASN